MDRFDMVIKVWAAKEVFENPISESDKFETADIIRKKVEQVVSTQKRRYKNSNKMNSDLNFKEIMLHCPLPQDALNMLKRASQAYSMTPRAYYKCIKVARTIADMEGSPNIELKHITEALQYKGY